MSVNNRSYRAWCFVAIAVFMLASCAGFGPYWDKGADALWGSTEPPAFSGGTPPGSLSILAISDSHGFDRASLVLNEATYKRHEAFWYKDQDTNYANTARVLAAAAEDPSLDFIILPGDISFEGEVVSHTMQAELLKRFSETRPELPIYVIPGNHDVNSPQAWQHRFLFTTPAKSVSAAQFAAIYSGQGYGSALSRDGDSLSYVVEPLPGVALVMLDTARWKDNSFFPVRMGKSKGAIRPATLAWLESILAEARRLGMLIVVAQHHPLDADLEREEPSLPGSAQAAELYARYGVSLIISGHRHRFSETTVLGIPSVTVGSVAKTPAGSALIKLDGTGAVATLNPYALE